jgi:hypothetical protein
MLLVTCPHCDILIEIESINCAIFRCGILKQTGQQIPPHAPKAECDRLTENQLIWGCGKPFRVVPVQGPEGGHTAEPCDYI